MNNRDWTFLLHSLYANWPFIARSSNSKLGASQGTQMHQREQKKAVCWAKSPSVCLWVWTRQAWRTWRQIPAGQQSALNWPAVPRSFCCPEAQREAGPCQKKKGERHSRATWHAATKPVFTRGSIQNRPTGSKKTVETICSNQGWSLSFYNSTTPMSVVTLPSSPTTQN